jgi:hypothetical protein
MIYVGINSEDRGYEVVTVDPKLVNNEQEAVETVKKIFEKMMVNTTFSNLGTFDSLEKFQNSVKETHFD